MARKTKDAPGRVTPKGGGTATKGGAATSGATAKGAAAGKGGATHTGRTTVSPRAATPSGRYTAPIPDEYRSSPWWVPAMILTFFGIGVLMIVLDYLGILPAAPSNWYLLGGLGGIVLGFITATRYH